MNRISNNYRVTNVKFMLTLALLFGFLSSTSMITAEERPLASPEAGQLPDIESMTVAQFALSEGGEARFLANSETGEIGYYENGNLDRRRPYFGNDLQFSFLDRFIRLAPDNSAIPKAIFESEAQPDRLRLGVSSRRVVERLPGIITAKPDPQAIQNDEFTCNNNNTTAYFADDFCHSSGGGSRVELCHSGHWHKKTTEHHKRNRIFSVAIYCSHPPSVGGYGRITHERKKDGNWFITYYGLPIQHNYYRYVDWGGKKHGRRAVFNASRYPSPNNSYQGYTRSYSVLYND